MNEIYSIIKKYIDEYDFENLLAIGAPLDEYNLESERISDLITNENSIEEIATAIASVLKSSFGCLEKVNVNKTDSFMEIAKKIKNDLSL